MGTCDHGHSLCLSCGFLCAVSLNHSKITAEKGIPPSFCLKPDSDSSLVFDLNFFLAGRPEASAVSQAVCKGV